MRRSEWKKEKNEKENWKQRSLDFCKTEKIKDSKSDQKHTVSTLVRNDWLEDLQIFLRELSDRFMHRAKKKEPNRKTF